jgi:hypothetical protein
MFATTAITACAPLMQSRRRGTGAAYKLTRNALAESSRDGAALEAALKRKRHGR